MRRSLSRSASSLRPVAAQRAVGKVWPAPRDGAGALKELAKPWRESRISGIDGVLGIADEMSEAELMVVPRPAHLSAKAIGEPGVRTVITEEFGHGSLAAVWMDEEAAGFGMVEHPDPPVALADARTGLIGGQNGAGKKLGADLVGLPGENRSVGGQHLDERPFADLDPEQVGEQADHPLE